MLVITMNKEKFSSIMESICTKYINLTDTRTEHGYKWDREQYSRMKKLNSLGIPSEKVSKYISKLESDLKNYEIFRQAALYKTMAEMHEGDMISVDEKTSEFIQLYNNV